jgi:hypothetical protein
MGGKSHSLLSNTHLKIGWDLREISTGKGCLGNTLGKSYNSPQSNILRSVILFDKSNMISELVEMPALFT